MNKSIVAISTLVLVIFQVTASFAANKDRSVITKVSMPSCAVPAKSTKLTKASRIANRCDADDHRGPFGVGVVPLAFGGAIVAGVVAVAVSTTDNNSPTSP